MQNYEGVPIVKVDEATIRLGADPQNAVVLANLVPEEEKYAYFLTGLNPSHGQHFDNKLDNNRKQYIDSIFKNNFQNYPNFPLVKQSLKRASIGINRYTPFIHKVIIQLSHQWLGKLYLMGEANSEYIIHQLESAFTIEKCKTKIVTEQPKDLKLMLVQQDYHYQRNSCNEFLRNDLVHFVVLLRGTDAIIGPFVNFGVTPCINCAYDLLSDGQTLEFKSTIATHNPILENTVVAIVASKISDYITTNNYPHLLVNVCEPGSRVSMVELPKSSKCGCSEYFQA